MINYSKDYLLISKKENIYACLVNPDSDIKDKNFGLRVPFVIIQQKNIKKLLKKKFGSFNKGFLIAIKSLEKYLNIKYESIYKTKYRYLKLFKKNRMNIILLRVISLILAKNYKQGESIFLRLINNNGFIYLEHQRLRLNPKKLLLYYLAGIIAGDGHLSKNENEIIIVDGSSKKNGGIKKSKEYIYSLKKQFQQEFQKIGKIRNYKTWYALRIESKWINRYMSYYFRIPLGDKAKIVRLPKFNLKYEKIFWRGLMDTDGSAKKDAKQINFVSSSKYVVKGFIKFCKEKNIKYEIGKKNNSWHIQILSISLLNYAKNIGFAHPRKQKLLINYLKEGSKIKYYYCFNKQLSKEQQELIKFLRPYRKNVYIKLDEFNRKAKKRFIKELLFKIKKFFNVKIIRVKRLRYNDHYYICSKEFTHFVKKNTRWRYLWPKLNDYRIKKLKEQWKINK